MTRRYLRYAVQDALDRGADASLLILPRLVFKSMLETVRKKANGEFLSRKNAAKAKEENVSILEGDASFDVIGFGIDKYECFFSNIRVNKHKLNPNVIRKYLSNLSAFNIWLSTIVKYRRIIGFQYVARYVAGYRYAEILQVETEILVFTETRNAYIYGILDGVERTGERKNVFFSHLLASGDQQKYFDSGDYIVSVSPENCALYNASTDKQFATKLFRVVDGYRLGLDKRSVRDVWVWVGQEALFEQEKKALLELVALAGEHETRLIYWARSEQSIGNVKGWLKDCGIETDLTSTASYLPTLCFGYYSNLLMTLSIFGVKAITLIKNEGFDSSLLLKQMREYGIGTFDEYNSGLDESDDYRARLNSTMMFKSESKALKDFICE